MARSLESAIHRLPDPAGCCVRVLDTTDQGQVFERGDAQTDAFLEGQPYEEVASWMTRTMPHQLAYGTPNQHPNVVALEDATGRVLAFADLFCDHKNKIGEFEPVGTRKEMRGRGLAKAVLSRGLTLMREAGIKQAVVRTRYENAAAIAAYAAVGFEVSDHLLNFRKGNVHTG